MRSFTAPGRAALLALLAFSPACGGDDDDDDGGGDGDDGAQVDAGADAGPDGGSGGAENALGVSCDADLLCPRGWVCLRLGDAPDGFCSKGCASTPEPPAGEEPELPPVETFETCADGYTDDPDAATPACAAPMAPADGEIPWACILACGETAESDYGECPSNLTCDQPDPESNGFCLPPM